MIRLVNRLFALCGLHRRLTVIALASVAALPLLAQPELWRYLTAALVVNDLLVRLRGDKRQEAVGKDAGTVSQIGAISEGVDEASEPDTIRTGGDQPRSQSC